MKTNLFTPKYYFKQIYPETQCQKAFQKPLILYFDNAMQSKS